MASAPRSGVPDLEKVCQSAGGPFHRRQVSTLLIVVYLDSLLQQHSLTYEKPHHLLYTVPNILLIPFTLHKIQQTPTCGPKMAGRALVSTGTFILLVSFLSKSARPNVWKDLTPPARSLMPVGLTPWNKAQTEDCDLAVKKTILNAKVPSTCQKI